MAYFHPALCDYAMCLGLHYIPRNMSTVSCCVLLQVDNDQLYQYISDVLYWSEALVRTCSPQCQWSNSEGYELVNHTHLSRTIIQQNKPQHNHMCFVCPILYMGLKYFVFLSPVPPFEWYLPSVPDPDCVISTAAVPQRSGFWHTRHHAPIAITNIDKQPMVPPWFRRYHISVHAR